MLISHCCRSSSSLRFCSGVCSCRQGRERTDMTLTQMSHEHTSPFRPSFFLLSYIGGTHIAPPRQKGRRSMKQGRGDAENGRQITMRDLWRRPLQRVLVLFEEEGGGAGRSRKEQEEGAGAGTISSARALLSVAGLFPLPSIRRANTAYGISLESQNAIRRL